MTSRQRLRRFAAVVRKPLNLLLRRFAAAVLRRFAAVPKSPMKSICGGSAAVCVAKPPYPLCAPRRHAGAHRGRSRGRRQTWRLKPSPPDRVLAWELVP